MSAVRTLAVFLVLVAAASQPSHGALYPTGDGENRSGRQQVDAATLVVVVDGMMKSRSGAT